MKNFGNGVKGFFSWVEDKAGDLLDELYPLD
jgi:hypothetical protein